MHKDMIEPIHQIHGLKDGTPWHTIYNETLSWYRRLSRYSGSILLVEACTIRHPPVAFRTQKVGELCGEVDSLTWPAAKRSAKNLSIASTCSRGNGHCFMTHYFEPGFRSISWRVPLSLGSSHATVSWTSTIDRQILCRSLSSRPCVGIHLST